MGRVVKGSARMVPAERVEAYLEAAEIRSRALEEARRIGAGAEAEAEALRGSAHAEGLEAARAEASAIIARAAMERDSMLAKVQDDVVELALEVARKVVGRELETSGEAAAEICARALSRVRGARAVLLRVSPDDRAAVEARSELLSEALGRGGAALRVVADEEVARGGCVVESDLGKVDARLEVQLAAIEAALRRDDG